MTNLTVLMYHYVRDVAESSYPALHALSIKNFRGQLEYINKYYTVITMQDVFKAVDKQKTIPQNSALLTFDDAYIDHYTTVFPILKEFGIQGSFFPPGKAVTEHQVLDVNKLHFVLAVVHDKAILIQRIFGYMNEERSIYKLEKDNVYLNLYAKENRYDGAEVRFIKGMLQKGLPEKLRSKILDSLFKEFVTDDETSFAKSLYMNDKQLKTMLEDGMYVGSHGYDHYWLDTLTPSYQEEQIRKTVAFLESLGIDISSWAMCYPYGAYDDSLIEILKKYCCKVGLATSVGLVDTKNDDPLKLNRLDTIDLPMDKNAPLSEWTRQLV